jgi:HD-like signal output (HDOD) protein/GGDEF domain-containing protein
MNPEMLERILSCPALPSLPSVAMRVIELTGRDNTKMEELSRLIESDQGLAAKVLRTVNSSYFGLKQRCGTIQRAVVMLGLGPIKTLVLGFSLVSAIRGAEGFDYRSYWRRALVSAAAARCVAEEKGFPWGDEAFLAALLQDLGMVAMYRALGKQYERVLAAAGPDHRALVAAELAQLEIQHPDIGAMLCQRWKLPPELVVPVKFHERPTAAPRPHVDLVRCVGLGNLLHDATETPDSGPVLQRLMASAQQWFGLDTERMNALIARTVEAAKELADLFTVDIGGTLDAERLQINARRQMVDITRMTPHASTLPVGIEGLVVDAGETDPLTGTLGRSAFDRAMRRAFDAAKRAGESVTVAAVSLEGLDMGGEGSRDSDDAIVTTSALLRKHFDPLGGVVCRLGGPLFAVLVTAAGQTPITAAAEEFRAEFRQVFRGGAVRACIGVATAGADTPVSPKALLAQAARGVQEDRATMHKAA